nr:hypothetical protein [Tanacetum cinerariifolium]
SQSPHVDKPKLSVVTPHSKKLHASMPSHSIPQPKEFNVMKHRNVIAPEMFKINPSQTFRVDLVPNKESSASIRTNPITNSQRHVTFKENVSSDTVTSSSTGLVHTARTRRPQPKGNTRNARVPSASKSSDVKKNEKEYAVLWNNWYSKCEECKYDKISYDIAYNDLQLKVERLQAQLRDLKGKSSNTLSVSNTLDLLNQKLELKIVELEFQVVNYERGISHLKTTYKNLFNSITSNRAHTKLHNLIYENAQLGAQVFENTSESMNNTSGTSMTPHVDKPKLSVVTPHSKKLHASMPSHSIPQPKEFNVMKHRNVIAPEMFK